MLRRQCSDTNQNIKRLVHVLPTQIVNSNVSSVGPSSERNVPERNVVSERNVFERNVVSA